MSAQRHKELFIKIVEANNRGDLSVFLDNCADEVVWRTVGNTKFAGAYHGKLEMIEKFLKPFFSEIKGEKIEFFIDKLFAEDHRLCCQCRGKAVTTKGNAYENEYAYVLTFNDEGKIVEFIEFNNSGTVNAAFER